MAKIQGLAVPFLSESGDLGGFTEHFELDSVELADDVILLYQHEEPKLMGRTSSGTLRLDLRSDGLYFDADLPNDYLGESATELIRRGDLKGCSFIIRVKDSDLDYLSDPMRRTVKKAIVREISIVSRPSYPQTWVEVVND